MPTRSSSRSSRIWPASAREEASKYLRRSISRCSSRTLGSGPPALDWTSASSSRNRATVTFSSRRSASSSWTSDSDGFVGSFDIPTQSRLKLPQSQVLHLAAQVSRLHLETLDALGRLEGKSVELARVDEQTHRELLAVRLDNVLVARDGPAGDLHLLKSTDSPRQHIDWASHVQMLVQKGKLLGLGRRLEDYATPVGDAVDRAQPRHRLHRRLCVWRREVRT